jgi:hypothetical protein
MFSKDQGKRRIPDRESSVVLWLIPITRQAGPMALVPWQSTEPGDEESSESANLVLLNAVSGHHHLSPITYTVYNYIACRSLSAPFMAKPISGNCSCQHSRQHQKTSAGRGTAIKSWAQAASPVWKAAGAVVSGCAMDAPVSNDRTDFMLDN